MKSLRLPLEGKLTDKEKKRLVAAMKKAKRDGKIPKTAQETTHSVSAPVRNRIAFDYSLKFTIALNLSFNSRLFSLNVTAPGFSRYLQTAAMASSRVCP